MRIHDFATFIHKLYDVYYKAYAAGKPLDAIYVKAVTDVPEGAERLLISPYSCRIGETNTDISFANFYIPVAYKEQPVVFMPFVGVWDNSCTKNFNQELYNKMGMPKRIFLMLEGNIKFLPPYVSAGLDKLDVESFDAETLYQRAAERFDGYKDITHLTSCFDENEFNTLTSLEKKWDYIQAHFIEFIALDNFYAFNPSFRSEPEKFVNKNYFIDCLKPSTEEPHTIPYETAEDLETWTAVRCSDIQILCAGMNIKMEVIGSTSKPGLRTSWDIDYLMTDYLGSYSEIYLKLKNCPYFTEVREGKFKIETFAYIANDSSDLSGVHHIDAPEVAVFKINRRYIPYPTETYIYIPCKSTLDPEPKLGDPMTINTFMRLLKRYNTELQPESELWAQYQQEEISKQELFDELYYREYPDQRPKVEPEQAGNSFDYNDDYPTRSYGPSSSRTYDDDDDNNDYGGSDSEPERTIYTEWSASRGEIKRDDYGNEWDGYGNALGNNPYGHL